MNYIIPALISFSLAIVFTLLVKKVALRFSIIDKPGERKIHTKPTALLGGVAIFLAFFISLFIFSPAFLAGGLSLSHLISFFLGGLIIILGGALDDKYNLKPRVQIIFPLLAIVILIIGGINIEKLSSPFGGVISLSGLSVISYLIISVWTLGMMYTTKLLDGVDGLVSGMGAIGALIIFLFTTTTTYFQPDIAMAAILLSFSILGFLVFNFHPAKIFLGEGGSLFIGYALGVLSIISGSKIAIALLIMGIPILDVFWTIARRVLNGKNPFKFSDNKHLHHRLLGLGLSQRQTVFVFYTLAAIFGVSGLFLQSKGKFLALIVLVILMVIVVSVFHFLDYRQEKAKPSLLLHICCAPCGTYATKFQLMFKYRVTWLFYNSNISTKEEYDKRLYWVKLMSKKFSIPLIVIPYEHSEFLEKVKGHEFQPERGKRCAICYLDRLELTAKIAKEKSFDFFSTTLLYSPFKNKLLISKIATDISKDSALKYLADDFSDIDVYNKSQKLAKDLGMYRQKFCGCEFSIYKKNGKK